LVDDRRDQQATKAAVAAIIARESADYWRPKFAAADCCATIMASLEEALADPQFVERGLFAHQIAGPSGVTMPALPVPIALPFRNRQTLIKSPPPVENQT
jgi:crotonobetainyl-CoA:carnitine CoA-transferase CaiB-like acyl-CoA transferase